MRLRAEREVNLRRQQFILGKQDEIEKLLADPSLSVEEVRTQTDAILAQILATDTDGVLLPLVKDNEDWINERLAERKAE